MKTIIAILALALTANAAIKPGTKIPTKPVPPLPMPAGETFRATPRPQFVTIPAPRAPMQRSIVVYPKSSGFMPASGPQHRAGLSINGPQVGVAGTPATLTMYWQNLCDFGDNQFWDFAELGISRASGDMVTGNLIESPILVTNQGIKTLNYAITLLPSDTYVIVYATLRGNDPQAGPIEGVIGHQIRVEQPLSIRVSGGNAIVRFVADPGRPMNLEARSSVTAAWTVLETIQPFNGMVERTYPATGTAQFYRTRTL